MGMILVFSLVLPLSLCFLLLRNALSASSDNMARFDAMGDGSKLKYRQRRRRRQTTVYLGIGLVLFCFFFALHPSTASTRTSLFGPPSRPRLTPELLNNLSLDEAQCNAAFPGLTKEVDDMVAKGPFIVKSTGDSGPLQARIKDNQLSIIHAKRRADLSQEMLNSRTAALHQLHRALLTSPTPLPSTILSLNPLDQPFGTALQYSRASDPSLFPRDPNARHLPIPHFSFWSWPIPHVGSLPRAAAAITALESTLPFAQKTPKAIWRGTTWYNSATSPGLRTALVKAAKDQPWADVEGLHANGSNGLMIEDFCRYKYIVHTEGVAYSGRFQFHQLCGSVVLAPPVVWMQHVTHLVRPVWSGELLRGRGWTGGRATERMRGVWEGVRAEEANVVFVERDWSDLGEVVGWLEEHPRVAEGIARRQRELFDGGGYLSPAAETCYWRAAVRGWASVARTEGEGWEGREGVPFEAFALSLEMGRGKK